MARRRRRRRRRSSPGPALVGVQAIQCVVAGSIDVYVHFDRAVDPLAVDASSIEVEVGGIWRVPIGAGWQANGSLQVAYPVTVNVGDAWRILTPPPIPFVGGGVINAPLTGEVGQRDP